MKRLELTGQTFGKWSVLREDGTKAGGVAWLCQCECGSLSSIRGSVLKRGRSQQCDTCKNSRSRARWTNSQGYVVMRAHGHSNSWRNGQMYEHVFVMSQALGRPLLPGESVHHKNGVRHDNRPENLELWVKHQPSGQRPEDLVVWAREILARYG